jgi:hypothetical protein
MVLQLASRWVKRREGGSTLERADFGCRVKSKKYLDFRIWQDFENQFKKILKEFGHEDFS